MKAIKNFRSEKAVTLTALVVTIIVMIILAAVSVIGLFGENGIFKSALTAKTDTETAAYEEELKAIEVQTRTQKMKSGSDFVYLEAFETNVKKNSMFRNYKEVEIKNDTTLRIVTKEGYIFYITDDEEEGVVLGGIAGESDDLINLVPPGGSSTTPSGPGGSTSQTVTFNCGIQELTKGPVKVTITVDPEPKQQLQYRIDNGAWTNIDNNAEIEMKQCGTVYARLYNGYTGGGVASTTITWIDNTPPRTPIVTCSSTESSITVTAKSTDVPKSSKSECSGNVKYSYRIEGNGKTNEPWTDYESTGTHEFSGLAENSTYTVYVRVIDGVGNQIKTPVEVKASTIKIPDANDNITITADKGTSEETWTKDEVNVTIKNVAGIGGYTLVYSTDGSNYQAVPSNGIVSITENKTVYAAYQNAGGVQGTPVTCEINYIDTEKPTVKARIEKVTSSQITVSAEESTDEESGIKAYYYSKDGGANWTDAMPNPRYTFEGLDQNKSYTIKVKVEDKAGNPAEAVAVLKKPDGTTTTTVKTEKIPVITGGNVGTNKDITFELTNNTEFVKTQKVTVVSNITLLDGWTLLVSKDGGAWEACTPAGYTFDRNGNLKVKISDGKNETNEIEYKVENVDITEPSISEIEVSSTSSNSVTVKVTSTDPNVAGYATSEVEKYVYTVNGGIPNEVTVSKMENGLTIPVPLGETALLEIYAVDKAGNGSNTVSKEVRPLTEAILEPGEVDENGNLVGNATIAFKYSPSNNDWSKSKTVELVIKDEIQEDYTVKYAIENEEFVEYTHPFDVTKSNSVVTVRLYSGNTVKASIESDVLKIDSVAPKGYNFGDITVHKNTITVTGTAEDEEGTPKSDLDKISFAITDSTQKPAENSSDWKGTKSVSDRETVTYTFEELSYNTTYYVHVKLEDKAGNVKISTCTNKVETGSNFPSIVPGNPDDPDYDLEKATIKYSTVPARPADNGYVKGPVTVKLGLQNVDNPNDYTIMYTRKSPSEGGMSEYPGAGIPMAENGTIYVCLSDGKGNYSDWAPCTINYIDSEGPTGISVEPLIRSVNSITVSLEATDTQSGVDGFEIKCAKVADASATPNWDTAVTKTVKASAGNTTVRLTGLEGASNYKIKVIAIDKVGNPSEYISNDMFSTTSSSEGEGGTVVVTPNTNISFTYKPVSTTEKPWTNEDVEVKLNLAGYNPDVHKIVYAILTDETEEIKWEDLNIVTKTFTVDKNCTIIARLNNLDNTPAGNNCYGEVSWIDKDEPANFVPDVEKTNYEDATQKALSFTVSGMSSGDPTSYVASYKATYMLQTELQGKTDEQLKAIWNTAFNDNTKVQEYVLTAEDLKLTTGKLATVEFSGLRPNRTYEFKMRAYDKAGNYKETIAIPGNTDSLPNLVEGTYRDGKIYDASNNELKYGIAFEYAGGVNGWAKDSVAATIHVSPTIDFTKLSIEYTAPGKADAKFNKASETITVDETGEISARLRIDFGEEKFTSTESVTSQTIRVDKSNPTFTLTEAANITKTSKTITLKMPEAQDVRNGAEESGIAKYEASIDSESNYKELKGEELNAYTFNGLEPNSKHKIYVRITDGVGHPTTKSIDVTTNSVLSLEQNDITYTLTSPTARPAGNGFVNTDVKVKIEYKGTANSNPAQNYQIKYLFIKDGTSTADRDAKMAVDANWTAYNATNQFTFTENGTVYVRYYETTENITKGNGSAYPMTWIDKQPPVVNSVTLDTTTAQLKKASVGATVAATDTGVSGVKEYYDSTTSTKPTASSTWKTLPSNGKITLTAPDSAGTHTFYVWVRDAAGNISAASKTVQMTVIDAITNGTWDASKSVGVNAPNLMNNELIPVYWTEGTNGDAGTLVRQKNADKTVNPNFDWSKWYDYGNKKWANAVTVDTSGNITGYFVWIPRFAYKIPSANIHTKNAAEISIEFLKNDTNVNASGATRGTAYSTTNYIVHPSFGNDPDVGGWSKNLTGYWIAKYEAGYQNGTLAADSNGKLNVLAEGKETGVSGTTGKGVVDSSKNYTQTYSGTNMLNQDLKTAGKAMSYPVFLPMTYSYNCIAIGDMEKVSQDIISTTGKKFYGITKSTSTDSHMMKNSEWGAVAYLSHSAYGINDEVWINNFSKGGTNNRYAVTGCYSVSGASTNSTSTGTSVYTYSKAHTDKVIHGSTTGNVYGVYDMSGGLWEYVPAGLTSSSYGISSSTTTKYRTVYSAYNNTIYGDAIYETSSGAYNAGASGYQDSWHQDYSNFVYSSAPFFLRGGDWSDATTAGAFCFYCTSGYADYYYGFRVVLVAE